MSADFAVGDLVFMPSAPWAMNTIGHVIDIRDYGIEIWVRTISKPRRTDYTYYDQFSHASILDRLIADDDPTDRVKETRASSPGHKQASLNQRS